MDYVYAPTIVQVRFGIEPVCNLFESMDLLTSIDELSGMNPWVYETEARLPEEIRKTTDMLVNAGVWHLIGQTPDHLIAGEFEPYLQWLGSLQPEVLRGMMASWLWEIPNDKASDLREAIFDDADLMMTQVKKWTDYKTAQKGHQYDIECFTPIFPLLKDAKALQTTLLENLYWMWDNVLREEWERKLPLLQSSLEAYQQHDYQNMTAVEAVRAVSGRDMTHTGWEWPFSELIFVPSPHLGPYIGRFDAKDHHVARVMFGVRQPPNTRGSLPELSRSELTPRLTALADDTRLRILEIVAQQDEICAQDIMSLLDLTQSAASRNLRQLVATGYLVERRQETAKCYSINRERIDDTMRALRRMLRRRGDNT
jgi:DNA-binding transcriptional ArsR family regulator